MTTRKTLFLDRAATLLLALVLLVGGAAAIWWWSGEPLAGRTLPQTTDTRDVLDTVTATWFAWAAAGAGLVLGLVGLRWIVAHLGGARVRRLRLAGSDDTGRLEVSGGRVAEAAADDLAETPGVRSADGVVLRDRGQLVAELEATLEPSADLDLVTRRAEEVAGRLGEVLGRDDLHYRVRLRVASQRRVSTRSR